MHQLFEHQNAIKAVNDFSGLEDFLDSIWKNREKSPYFSAKSEDTSESQRFLNFLYRNNEIKSNKYVGVIHYNGHKIDLLPKIFYNAQRSYSEAQVSQIHNHILWWLSYCRKIKFPNYQTALGEAKSDFFEVLVYLFAKYTHNLLSSSIYLQYEEVQHELNVVKGRINAAKYINENIRTGRWHKVNCTYDSFELDNEFNQIIKYVATILFNASSSQDNKKLLREILYILDDVSDVKVTAEQCAAIKFNPMFGAFETVRDYCHLFLSNSVSFNYKNNLQLFAFLLPMEYVFEDFIYGFISTELEEITAKSQRGDIFLDNEKNFALRPDLWIKTESFSCIADTKYKIVYSDSDDARKGISQADLYQMLAYAIRFEVKNVQLLYPGTVVNYAGQSFQISVTDALANNTEVKIEAYQVPIIDATMLNTEYNNTISISELFEPTRIALCERLREVFRTTIN
jgi:5-methylcytosine-specific restriction enzyme subunit McrC